MSFLSHLEFRIGHNPFMDPNISYVLLYGLLCHWTNFLQSHSGIKKSNTHVAHLLYNASLRLASCVVTESNKIISGNQDTASTPQKPWIFNNIAVRTSNLAIGVADRLCVPFVIANNYKAVSAWLGKLWETQFMRDVLDPPPQKKILFYISTISTYDHNSVLV
jgi:hypothetical protein